MRFFKEFNHLTRPSKDPLINDNLKNEMKFQFEKVQNIDNIKSKRNEN